MERREFITLLGGAAATWQLAARAQQSSMPLIGYLGPGSAQSDAFRVTGFRQGLKEAGYVEGQNLTIEYRWAEEHHDRLPTMATDLVLHQVAVIVATGAAASLAAKAATTTLPIVFETSGDPVKLGLVGSLSRPGGNLTGVSQLGEEEAPKRLELLHELLPTARVMALLVNPAEPIARDQVRVSLAAAKTLGLELNVINASIERDSGQTKSAFLLVVRTPAGLTNPIGPRTDRRADSLVRIDFGNKGALSIRSCAHS
jgi:putative tryptophan/tyrosine transport system substrate-binding protein